MGGPRPGPEPKSAPVREGVERIGSGAEPVGGKRLAPALALWRPHSARHDGTLIRDRQMRPGPIRVTRSRPCPTHDTAPVEQTNWRWPRPLRGYGRLEDEPLGAAIPARSTEAWGPLQNVFLPSMKLGAQWREGRRWVRRQDEPRTADPRLRAQGDRPAKARRERRDRDAARDPFGLAAQVERRWPPIRGAALPV